MTEVQRFIEREIKRLGSVAALQRATGNSIQNINKWRTGEIREPSRESLRRLAKATGTPEAELVRMAYG